MTSTTETKGAKTSQAILRKSLHVNTLSQVFIIKKLNPSSLQKSMY